MLERIDGPSDLKRLSVGELEILAREIRETLVARVTENGGHLASNLGVVELTLALHTAFDSPRDKLVWDVGHQAYVHKLVTGRRDLFSSIRTYGGLSGFCSREESPHDAFGAGHAGTSVSAALGLALGRDHRGTDEHVIAIIGDGAMSCGLAFEGLNNAGHLGSRLIVVLNDNEMSIAPNVGALASYLARARTNRRYHRAKAGVEWTLKHVPRGSFVLAGLKRIRHAARALFVPNAIWEELGFTYVGPLDGHNLGTLVDVFRRVQLLDKPVLVHVVTKKGKGYPPAEKDAVALHGVSPKRSAKAPGEKSANGVAKLPQPKPPTYTQVFGETLIALAAKDPRIVAITAAMPDGTGLSAFQKRFPERCFDVGIAEAHAVTFAAGLAASGMRPVVAIYSTFLQRAYDSIVHDVCIQNLPVVFALDRAGLVGEDGRTHHGAFDLANLRTIPNLVVMAPRDEAELQRMLVTALALDGPVAIRYPRGAGTGATLAQAVEDIAPLELGRGVMLREASSADICLLAIGSMVEPALEAADLLGAQGIVTAVLDARFAKPLDEGAILEMARKTRRVVTVEENILAGGFGSAVLELLAAKGLSEGTRVAQLGLPDSFVDHGPPELLRDLSGLTASGICLSILAAFPDLERAAVPGSGEVDGSPGSPSFRAAARNP